MTLASVDSRRAHCADMLDVVDKAFARPKSAANHYLATRVCPGCPIAAQCLRDALDNGEHGTWGALTERQRRRNKNARHPATYNLRNAHYTLAHCPSV